MVRYFPLSEIATDREPLSPNCLGCRRRKIARATRHRSSMPRQKSSNRVWLPRLKFKTARHVDLRRAVSLLFAVVYVNLRSQHGQFKQPLIFDPGTMAVSGIPCGVMSYGVQIQLPLSRFATLVRVLMGSLTKSGRYPIQIPIRRRASLTKTALPFDIHCPNKSVGPMGAR
jgi:hypothetical protein